MNFEDIFRLRQGELKHKLASVLRKFGYKPQERKGFVYAEGDIPVLFVAHLDTVHKDPVKDICYSPDKNIIMSPQGIGGDDRCGVYMILNLLKGLNGKKPSVVFTEDEEIGAIGAKAFCKSEFSPDVNYIVEFDRAGDNDAVFYDCDNPEFTSFIEEHGFVERYGSFSDISYIAPSLGVAAVNISSGYFNPHTLHEYINISIMNRNVEAVREMIQKETPKFEYVESYYGCLKYKSSLYNADYEYHYSKNKGTMSHSDKEIIVRNAELDDEMKRFEKTIDWYNGDMPDDCLMEEVMEVEFDEVYILEGNLPVDPYDKRYIDYDLSYVYLNDVGNVFFLDPEAYTLVRAKSLHAMSTTLCPVQFDYDNSFVIPVCDSI